MNGQITHWIPPFTKVRGKGIHAMQLADCGTWVDESQYSDKPTCEGCKAQMEADAEAVLSLDDVEMNPIAHVSFDPLAGYAERRR